MGYALELAANPSWRNRLKKPARHERVYSDALATKSTVNPQEENHVVGQDQIEIKKLAACAIRPILRGRHEATDGVFEVL